MSSTSRQDGKVDQTFIKGLDLILESLISKNDVLTVEARAAADDDIELAEVDGIGKAVSIAAPAGPTRCVRKDAHSHDDDEDGNAYIHDDDDQENDALATSTDLGDKTNLPPEMGRKDEGKEGLIGDGSIAEPNLRIRKAILNDMERGIDLFKMWATVDRMMTKSESSTYVSDIDILIAFDLDPTVNVDLIDSGTIVYKMIADVGSRPSSEWWKDCISFAKSFEGMEEPAFFASFLYYEPATFDPNMFLKGLNDTGATPRTSRRGVSHDTEIDENIGAAGGQAIDGLGLSNDGHEDEEEEHVHKA